MSIHLVIQTVLIVTIAVGFSGSLLAWKERPKPGAVPLTILMAGQCWWSTTLLFRVNATGMQQKIFWTDATWVGVAILPVAWLFFSLSYTGYTKYLQRRYVVLASIVPVLTIVFGLTNEVHQLMYTDSVLVERGRTLIIDRSPGVWFWVSAYYTYLLGLLGAIPLVSFVSSDLSIFRAQSMALLTGLLVPWATNALHLLGVLPTRGIDPTPIAFSLSALLFLGALTRFQLFGTNPAPIRPARRLLFDQMEDGLIVLDINGNVIEMNGRAAAAVGAAPFEVLGRPVDDAIPELPDLEEIESQSGRTILRPDNGAGSFDVSMSKIHDTHGRTTGCVLSLHDISEYLRQQQRLEVLNRVFRHNVRTNSQVILSQIEYLSEHDSDAHAEIAEENVLDINEYSDKIRTILDVFERGREESQPVRLAIIVDDRIAEMTERYPAASIRYDGCPETLYVDSVMDDVFTNVVENALQHNTNADPEVWIDVEHEGETVCIDVTDNGPGIDDEELAILDEGTETPLNHGSGLGLALIAWGTEFAGGSVIFEDNEPTGVTVSIEVPVLRVSD